MTKADKRENIIMIASEPLTFERSDWMEVKTNTMIVITPKVRLGVSPILPGGDIADRVLDECAADTNHRRVLGASEGPRGVGSI